MQDDALMHREDLKVQFLLWCICDFVVDTAVH